MNPVIRKISNFKSVGFRPGESLRLELEKLSEELSRPDRKVTISQILREGVTVFWPHIRAYMRAQAKRDSLPPEVVARLVVASIRAHQSGLHPSEIVQALSQALSKKQAR